MQQRPRTLTELRRSDGGMTQRLAKSTLGLLRRRSNAEAIQIEANICALMSHATVTRA
jgi:hypothetical protein